MMRRNPAIGGVDWAIGVLAVATLLVSGGTYFYHWTRLRAIAAEHLRLVVVGPSRLTARSEAEYYVRTHSISGRPVPAQIELAFYTPDGKRLWGHREKADATGQLRVRVPSELRLPSEVRLEVLAVHQSMLERMQARVVLDPPRYFTRLSTDRPRYTPGQTVYYRSLTLSRYALLADREFPIRFEILDPQGEALAGAVLEGITRSGVGNGLFRLPADAEEGTYRLVAHALDGSFPSAESAFQVRREPLPPFEVSLDLDQQCYLPGQTVKLQTHVQRRPQGTAAALPPDELDLKLAAVVDGKKVFEKTGQTDAQGRWEVEFRLPEQIDRGDGRVELTCAHAGRRFTFTQPLPVLTQGIDVRFFPEGGVLAPDLENRVYFTARTPQGVGLHLRALLVDNQNNELALVQTQVKGVGRFRFTPARGESYRLKIIEPPAAQSCEPRLPPALSSAKVTINTGTKIFAPGEPLEFTLRASQAGLPLVITAWCRGVLVGQQTLITSAENGDINSVVLPLAPSAGGVVRLVAFDYGDRPPRAVAERLVFVRPGQRLNVAVLPDDRTFVAGETAELEMVIRDERGTPVPAILAVRLVEQDVPAADVPLGGEPTTDLLLEGELTEIPSFLEEPLLLADDADAAMKLDLLLGTQPARGVPSAAVGLSPLSGQAGEQVSPSAPGTPPASIEPPLLFDNLGAIQAQYEESLAQYRSGYLRNLSTLGILGVLGAAGLTLAVVMLGLLKAISGARFWILAATTGTCCAAVAFILMDPANLRGEGNAPVPFTPYRVTPQTLDQRGSTSRRTFSRHPRGAAEPADTHATFASDFRPAPASAVRIASGVSEAATLPGNSGAPPGDPVRPAAFTQPVAAAPKRLPKELIRRLQTRWTSQRAGDQSASSAHAGSQSEAGQRSDDELDKQLAPYRFPVHRVAGPAASRPGENLAPATVFWDPLVETGKDGRALVRLRLPQRAGVFWLLVEAHGGGRIGSATARIVSVAKDGAQRSFDAPH